MPTEDLDIDWRRLVTDAELDELTASHDGSTEPGWWDRVRDHSLGWVTARTESGQLVGFVNVAWDGGTTPFCSTPRRAPTTSGRGWAPLLYSVP